MEELCPSQLVDEPPLSQGEQGQARVGTPLGLGRLRHRGQRGSSTTASSSSADTTTAVADHQHYRPHPNCYQSQANVRE